MPDGFPVSSPTTTNGFQALNADLPMAVNSAGDVLVSPTYPPGVYYVVGQGLISGATAAGVFSFQLVRPGIAISEIGRWIPDANPYPIHVDGISTITPADIISGANNFHLQWKTDAALTGAVLRRIGPLNSFGNATSLIIIRLA